MYCDSGDIRSHFPQAQLWSDLGHVNEVTEGKTG